MKKTLIIIAVIIAVAIPAILVFGASNTTPATSWEDKTVQTAQPIDVTGWIDAVTKSTNTTTLIYTPGSAATTAINGTTKSTVMYVRNYNGILVRARYDKFAVVTANPVVRAWGYRNSSWQPLPDSNGNYDITLSSDTTVTGSLDVTEGFKKWTAPVKIPTLGCFKIVFTVRTAYNVTLSTSAAVEAARY